MDKKLKIFAGLTIAFATSSFLFYLRESNKPLYQKIKSSLSTLRSAIEDQYQSLSNEELSKRLEDNAQFTTMIEEFLQDFCDVEKLAEEISKHPFFKQLNKSNFQVQLFNVEYSSQYLKKNSLQHINGLISNISKDVELVKQDNLNLSQNANQFMTFIFLGLLMVISEIEEILMEQDQQKRIVQVNIFFHSIIDACLKILKVYPHLNNLIAACLLVEVNKVKSDIKLFHNCEDTFYAQKLKENEPNNNCKCLLFELLLRYISLITPTLQKKLITILIDFKVFQTKEHLVQLGQILFKNGFYLNSQLSVDSMYYVADVSPMNHLLVQVTAFPEVRQEITKNYMESFDQYLLYQERVLTQNQPKFWSRLMASFISSHAMIYPLFADKQSLQFMFTDEKKTNGVLIHFLGILLILETRETYEITAENDNSKMMDWLAQNVDTLLAAEIIAFLQLQYIQTIIAHFPNQTSALFAKGYLQCLRVTQNKRIQDRTQRKKMFEVSASLTKLMGFLILIQQNEIPTKNKLEEIVNIFPFQDDTEKTNIFTNMLRILFDLPTMNLHFLKYIQPKCQKLSQEASMSFNGYFTHILSASTLSFDSFMTTLQVSLLFGKCDILIGEIKGRLERDFSQFETYKDFLTRDLILLVDLIENPYYCLNILKQNQRQIADLKDIEIPLHQRVAISLMKLNKEMYLQEFFETLSLFIYLKEVPSYIMELLEPGKDGKYKLREQYQLNSPFMCLQKDMESVNLFLSQVEDYYDELLYSPESFPFLKDLRKTIYQSNNFIQLIQCCVRSKNRMNVEIWVSKFLYYGKQTLYLDPSNGLLLQLFQDPEVISFIDELEKKGKAEKLVNYLRA